MIRKLLIFIVIVSCWQCQTKTPTNNNNLTNSTSNNSTHLQKNPIPRGMARVVAKVVKVSPINKAGKNTACAKNPCEATIKVEKVVGYGSNFQGDLSNGQQLEAYFIKTLGDTQKIFPALKQHFPGLKKKDRFEADVLFNPKATQVSRYQVISYKKL